MDTNENKSRSARARGTVLTAILAVGFAASAWATGSEQALTQACTDAWADARASEYCTNGGISGNTSPDPNEPDFCKVRIDQCAMTANVKEKVEPLPPRRGWYWVRTPITRTLTLAEPLELPADRLSLATICWAPRDQRDWEIRLRTACEAGELTADQALEDELHKLLFIPELTW